MDERTSRSAGNLLCLPAEEGEWVQHSGSSYRCQVALAQAGERWVATATMLPGVAAEGETDKEALEKIKAALSTVVAEHKASGRAIPWTEALERLPTGAVAKWVIFRLPATNSAQNVSAASMLRIVKTPGVCGGDPCIRDTRLTVWGLEEWRRQGWPDAKILDNYPQLSPEDLAAAWAYVAEHREEIDKAIQENREA